MARKFTREEVITKIEGLLNMTTERGCTEEEASNASRAAAKLLLQYGIDMSEVEMAKDTKAASERVTTNSVEMVKYHQDSWKWQVNLAGTIAKVCGCNMLFNQPLKRYGGRVQFIGRPTNIKVAQNIFLFLTSQLNKIAIQARVDAYTRQMANYGNYTIGRGWFSSYLAGISARVGQRLMIEFKQDVKEAGPEASGMMLAKFDENDAFIKDKYKKVRTVNTDPNINVAKAFHRGVSDGNHIAIQPHAELGTR